MSKEDLFAAFVIIGIDISFHPGFDPAVLIAIDPGAFGVKLVTALETIDIEVPHIGPDLLKVFDQLAVSHDGSPPHYGIVFCGYCIIPVDP